jgi:hypothetical protein
MDLRINIELPQGLLLATATGEVSLDEVTRLFKQVFDKASENGVSKILVDSLAAHGELATFERYELGVEVAAYITRSGSCAKLALVGRFPTVNGFAARVARNRGIVTEVFPNLQQALTWLESLPD